MAKNGIKVWNQGESIVLYKNIINNYMYISYFSNDLRACVSAREYTGTYEVDSLFKLNNDEYYAFG